MRKLTTVLSVFLLTSLFCLKAQEDLELRHRHELKLNLGSSVFLAFPEVSYEYLLSEDMTVGASMGFGFDTEDSDGYSFKATPFLRWFFGDWSWFRRREMEHPATGFFLEANGAVGSYDIYSYDYIDYKSVYTKEKSLVTGGMGFAFGWKYLSKNNWTAELFSGAGRNFNYDKDYDESKIYFRMGISIGKRF
ncbi:MAG: DUF3575 domain-containing protein [Dysgonamonadaceae bacterium]